MYHINARFYNNKGCGGGGKAMGHFQTIFCKFEIAFKN